MRLWIISDTHWGVHSTQQSKWLKVIEDYHNNFFIPLLQKEWKAGDRILHLGDVFDDRSRIDLSVHNACFDWFKTISDLGFQIDVIVGNHDVYRRGDNSIHSLKMIDRLPGLTIHTEPIIPEWNKNILLMPWVEHSRDEKAILKKYETIPYIFCHSELRGAKMNVKSTNYHDERDVVSVDDFRTSQVYSGHIHIRQKNKNFTFVGSPYHMDRNDSGDQKGIYLLDLVSGTEQFFPNNYSPQFVSRTVSTLEDLKGLDAVMSKDWVDLTITEAAINDKTTRKGLESLLEKATPTGVNYEKVKSELTETEIPDVEEFEPGADLLEVSMKYIRETINDDRAVEIVKRAFNNRKN